jgi:hypothetical protein
MRITIGRTERSQVHFADKQCSSVHCRMWVEAEKLWVEDLESKNGTYVNGVKIVKSEVFLRDVVSMGETNIVVSDRHCDAKTLNKLEYQGSHDERTLSVLTVQTAPKIKNAPSYPLKPPLQTTSQPLKHIKGFEIDPSRELYIYRWNESWRHWVAAAADISLITVAFVVPFVVMFKFDAQEQLTTTIPSHLEVIKSPRLMVTSLCSLVSGLVVWSLNTQNHIGTLGERLSGLADVPRDYRKGRRN